MPYTIRFRKRATKEYLGAIAWYKERSLQAAEKFVSIVPLTLNEIERRPEYFRKKYKHFHETKTKRYPFAIVYFIDEAKQFIVITTLFHQKRNPEKKFRR